MSKQICDTSKSNKQLMFAKNLEKGRIAEKIAIEDYENHGFIVTRTGVGSDFVAEKIIENLIELRSQLREARQFQLADEIRSRLDELGIALEDTPKRTIWKRER